MIIKTCILTIIKNEHLYLDEWIKYHLGIGINHIFILEDIDSDTHCEITAKYKDAVSLMSVSFVLSEKGLKRIKSLKFRGEMGGQATYTKAGLRYIKSQYDYDWCFVIDCDEFLTLKNLNINEVCSLYANYDAFLLQWECYGANGLIHKPDYSCKGVVETYTKICDTVSLSSPAYNKKICFNLKTYCNDFWNNVHTPNENCHHTLDTNLYIRHYITKSWEEYLWKKNTRGYFFGASRTYDAFFKMNPDLLPLKEELITNINKEVLVVLPYANSGAQGHELEIALTAWNKFCQFPYHFVVIGDCNEQLVKKFNWVEWIPCGKIAPRPDQYNAHLDMQHKMEIAYNKFKDKYNGFIWMVDDNYAIRPFTLNDIKTIHYHQKSFKGNSNLPTSFWKYDKYKTRQLLDKEEWPHCNYTTHYPCYFEFTRLHWIWNTFDLRNNSYVIEDIYFNSFMHNEPILDATIRYGLWSRDNIDELDEALNNSEFKFVCNSREGWCPELEEKLWNHLRKD